MNTHRGILSAQGMSMAICAGNFNEAIVERLHSGAIRAFEQAGGAAASVQTYWCPGAFEMPTVLTRVLATQQFDLAVAVGAVIRGATPHFDYVCATAANGIARLSADTGTAIGFGVLTCNTIEQAWERAGTKAGNKGYEATMAAIETATLLRGIG